MVTVVVVINTGISLVCLYVAWRVWKLRKTLARVADAIDSAERSTYKTLHGAPKAISKGQVAGVQLGERYRQLELQLQRVQQLLSLVALGKTVWQQNRPKFVQRPLSRTQRIKLRKSQLLR